MVIAYAVEYNGDIIKRINISYCPPKPPVKRWKKETMRRNHVDSATFFIGGVRIDSSAESESTLRFRPTLDSGDMTSSFLIDEGGGVVRESGVPPLEPPTISFRNRAAIPLEETIASAWHVA
jgi:hypothetical protein